VWQRSSPSRLDTLTKSEHGLGLDFVQGKVGYGFALLISQE
jgi:hypothetical protein